ncbi:hypothetical protein ACT048_25025, partial [Ectopseudomonas khazarica]
NTLKNHTATVGDVYTQTAGGNSTLVMDEKSILLQVGKSKIVLEDNGTITIEGLKIAVNGTELVDVDAKKIDLN